MLTESNHRLAVVLTEEELQFVKDALWYAARAEQVALADEPLFRDSFLAELRNTSNRREADGKPGFQDLFLALQGTPVDRLPVEAQRSLGVLREQPTTETPPPTRDEAPPTARSVVRPAKESGVSGVLRGIREFFLGE